MSGRCLCLSGVCRVLRGVWLRIFRLGQGAQSSLRSSGTRPVPSRAPALIAPTRPAPYLTVIDLSPEFVYELLVAKTVPALDRLFPVFLDPYLRHPDLQSNHSEWTARVRAVRALRAGVSARRVWLVEFHRQAASLGCPFDNHFYVVLRTRERVSPFFTAAYEVYVELVIDQAGEFLPESISHGFATLAEVEIFCRGAQIQWPQEILARH